MLFTYLSSQVEYTEVDVKLANLTDDELSDDEVIQRNTPRISPTTTPMEAEEQREGEEEEEEEDVPEGKSQMATLTAGCAICINP